MSVVADTSFLIDLARGDQKAHEFLDQLADEDESLLIPTLAVAEFLTGARKPAEELEKLAQAGELVAFGVPEALAAGALAQAAWADGRSPGWNDIFMAAVATARGLPLVTRNTSHFDGDVRTY